MESSILIWVAVIAVIAICAFVFYNRVKIQANLTSISVEAEDASSPKPESKVVGSIKVEVDQLGASQSEINSSEDVKITQRNK